MKKKNLLFLIIPLFLFSSCIFGNYWYGVTFSETRTGLSKTNIIGIVGEASAAPHIEIRYSVADEVSGYNKIVSRRLDTLPYIFQNNSVYMAYEYIELGDREGAREYRKILRRDFEEGGSEYFRIINHSPDKTVEFFIAGRQTGTFGGSTMIPSVRYKRAPIYFLLFPELKPTNNVVWPDGEIWYFEGDRIGDLTVPKTEAWTVEQIIALYRAEYARSDTTRLTIDAERYRMIDLITGKTGTDASRQFQGGIFYGTIQAGEELRGNENIWLLATPSMFFETIESGHLTR